MIRPFTPAFVLALSLGVAAALPAQSGKKPDKPDKDVERTADQIGRTVERAVDGAMRSVERTLDQTMRQLKSAGYLDERDWQRGGERIDTTFGFSRSGVIDLTSVSGDIVVTGWNRSDVRVHAQTERGRLRWNFSSSRVSIETENGRGRDGDTRYELSVPEGVRVVLRSTSGDLTAKGTRGAVDANTTSGDINVTDAADRVELQSLSGDIKASHLSGDVQLGTLNGDVEAEDVDARSLHAESTSGELVLGGVRSRDVSASAVSGDIQYRGTIEPSGQYEFHSHSGTITLNIPANTSARFSVETFSGDMNSAFPITLQPGRDRRQGRRLEFTLGGGDARVVAETFSGDVDIRRGDARREETRRDEGRRDQSR
jgi:DUF4097 and DUF4098 domain-containing protein YvlB